MNCKDVKKHLSAYLDGELSEQRARQVRRHLADCPECADQRDELSWVNRLLDEVPAVTVEDTFTAEVLEESTESVLARLRRSLWRPVSRWAVAAALAIAIITGSGLAWHTEWSDPAPTRVAERTVVTEQFGLEAFDDRRENSVGGAYVEVAWPQEDDGR